MDNTVGFRTTSPLDSDLCGGWRYPIFEQPGPDVFSSCSFIPRANFETSSVMVAMVTRYDVISSKWSSHFGVKIHVFLTSFNDKSKSCC